MTAEIAIMNRQGIALAADSAVTLGGSGKIYNSADKLFALSKYHPVGVMIYGSARFMDIAWETIIKCYRDDLRDKAFDHLSDYEGDFINYLSKFPHFTEKSMENFLDSTSFSVFSNVLTVFLNNIRADFHNEENIEKKKIDAVFSSTLDKMIEIVSGSEDQKHIKLDEDFIAKHIDFLHKQIEVVFENYKITDNQKEKLIKILSMEFQKCHFAEDDKNYSGIVIAGYGEREIFPTLCSFKVCGKLGKSLIYFDNDTDQITEEDDATIAPFAQTEMVHQFVRGIDREFSGIITEKVDTILFSIKDYINDTDNKKITAISDLMSDYMRTIMNTAFINPIINIVASMEKSEMVSMAEAMVNLTALKRHISEDEESVGGPVDVALITKGDGFIWIKKKTNYDPLLNRELNQNYFRSGKYGNF